MDNQVVNIKNKSVTTLYDDVKFVDSVINQAVAWNIEAANLQLEAEKELKAAQTAKTNNIIIKIGVVPLAFYLVVIAMPFLWGLLSVFGIDIYDFEAGMWISIIGAMFLSLFACVPVWRIRPKTQMHIDKAAECEKKSKDNLEASSMLIQKYANELTIIPQKYWYPMATNFLVEVVQTGRATTLPIALDKLEEQIHRWRMEESMQQQMALQMIQTETLRRIEINTSVSVAADVAGLFFG